MSTTNRRTGTHTWPPRSLPSTTPKQSSTGFSPFLLNYNQHPMTPQSLLNPQDTPVPAANVHARTFAESLRQARENISAAQERQKRFADAHRREEELEVGERVLISTKNLNFASQTGRPAAKLDHRWAGPFVVLEKNSAVSYKIDLPANMRVHPVFHMCVLKRYQEATNERFPGRNPDRPPPVIVDEEEEGVRNRGDSGQRDKTRSLVKWNGYPLSDASVIPENALKNTPDILQSYLRGVDGGV